jgi:WD40 repeat protein
VCAVRWRPQSNFSKTANVLVSGHADGYLRHWHATSGKCLHQKKCEDKDEEDNQLYTIDYNNDGTLLATAGKDKYVRLYDEQTKSIVLKMKEAKKFIGHSNRVFCVRFNPTNQYSVVSGGWDNTL